MIRRSKIRMIPLEITSTMIICFLSVTSCKQDSNSFSGSQRTQPARKPIAKHEPQPSDNVVPSPPPVVQPTPVTPPNGIVKGSFTVWAVPPNPAQDEDYDIHVRVNLPLTITSYAVTDLSGTLVGTDSYTQKINGLFDVISQRFIYSPGSAELVMKIPGADRGVDDTLNVASKVLNESQSILIHFN